MNTSITFNGTEYVASAIYEANEVDQVVPGSIGLFNTVTVWTYGTAEEAAKFIFAAHDGMLDTTDRRNMVPYIKVDWIDVNILI